ncbi:efflux RND transporter permease subunit [Halosquirtibacter laminarini]|uniref:Efflux RND transporter permease subunit n=1 Tax=Halosquirtibacter laminarini TaxID=3374600 RepID=A0AC61NRB7_9BACT|nr:efflux RND transporter permease subunit [Prolixibacteraceae bacterium]
MVRDIKYRSKLSAFSIILIFSGLIIIGTSLVPLINFQLEPSRSLPSIVISYSWPDASARVIEKEVTTKVEGLLNSIRGIQEIKSVTSKGNGRINLYFKKGCNLDAIRFEVATLIRRIYSDLPEQVSYPMLSLGTGGRKTAPLLTYTINASSNSYFIQKYAEDNIIPKISAIKGVNKVRVYGATPFEWEIRFDSNVIDNFDIGADEISEAVNNYFRKEIIGVGDIAQEGDEIPKNIRLSLENDIPTELIWEKIPIKKLDNRVVFLTDIASVSYIEQMPNSYFRINGLNAINVVIYPEINVNNIKLSKCVKAEIANIRKNLPNGFSILLANDSSEFISKELRKIGYQTLFSMLILLLFVLLITLSFRYLVLITISLFSNLILAVILYYLLEIEIHLYSLAGITVSFGILIDNSIIMIDHIKHHNNKNAFLAVLAATLTTIGSLSVIFYLKEQQRINLMDFALVIMSNLSVSLLIALFFIPALMEKISLKSSKKRLFYRRKMRVIKLTHFYIRAIVFGKRFKWAFLILAILSFGIPIHWLPTKVEKDFFFASAYNKTIGSTCCQEDIKPIAEKVLGGTLRLFTEHVFENSFYSDPQQTKLNIMVSMPEGCTVQQLNEVTKKIENYISQYDEIEFFKTRINGYQNSNITIQFKPEFENSSFPYYLKKELNSKALSMGGLYWRVSGLGRAFINQSNFGDKNSKIILEGYNYDQLYAYAEELKSNLLENERIQEVDINGGDNSWRTHSLNEYFIDFNREQFCLNEISLNSFYSYLNNRSYKRYLKPVFSNNKNQFVSLVSNNEGGGNVWDLKNTPIQLNHKLYKLTNLGKVKQRRTGNDIHKHNQQYLLNVAYNFIGQIPLVIIVRDEYIKEMNKILPLGYLAKDNSSNLGKQNDKKRYYLLILIIAIIFLLTSILFESLIQPLVVISMIPISYIGVFLAFYLFDFNFDQGGFASFILLSGLVVNAGLYIINDYNNLKRRGTKQNNMQLYLKAFNHKIIPILLTIISSVLGLIPFIWMGQNEAFWFSFAVGAIGGLIFSLIAIFIYLPILMNLEIK